MLGNLALAETQIQAFFFLGEARMPTQNLQSDMLCEEMTHIDIREL